MVRLLDGSMCSQLKQFGYDCNDEQNKPHWSFPANSDQILMENVYRSFLDIGVNNITTNTYHFGSVLDDKLPEKEANCKLYEKYFEETCSTLHRVAQQYDEVKIWGSVGTFATMYHDCSEYSGKYMDYSKSEENAYKYFKTILSLFQTKTNIKNLIFETISSQLEGEVALNVLKEFTEMTAVMSFTFKENACLRHGENIWGIAEKLKASKQIVGIGINCTDPEHVMPVLTEIEKYKFAEVFVYPNVGDSSFLVGNVVDPDVFSLAKVSCWTNHGATAIGGCCGITINMMKTLKNNIDILNNK